MSLLRRTTHNSGQPPQPETRPNVESEPGASRGAVSVKPLPPEGDLYNLKLRVQNQLLSEINPTLDLSKINEARDEIAPLFNAIMAEQNLLLNRAERHRVFEAIIADIMSLSDALMKDRR